MSTTTNYGSWYNVQKHELTVATTVLEACGDFYADFDLEAIESEYRDAIQAALPAGVALTGDEFIGPAYDDDKEFDGYPVDDYGSLDLTAIVKDIDLMAIVEKHDKS